MRLGKHTYYWDSCVFISLVTREGRTDVDMATLRQLESLLEIQAITIFTSAITRVEVLEFRKPEEEEIAQALLKRSVVASVNSKIVDIAREIRGYYRNEGTEILLPDAIHLASAIYYNATSLHTYDGCSKRPRKTDLLRLPNPIAGKYGIRICVPEVPDEFLPKEKIPEPAFAVETPGDLFGLLGSSEGEGQN
jgi:predicted nucleic acid-binding protein